MSDTANMDITVKTPSEEEKIDMVFVSYTEADFENIKCRLDHHFLEGGIRSFIARKNIYAGTKFYSKIVSEIEKANCGVIILSPKSIQSPWVMYEVGMLLGSSKRVVPYLLLSTDKGEEKLFIESLPVFLRKLSPISSITELVRNVGIQNAFGEIFYDEAINQRILNKIQVLKLTVQLKKIPLEIIDSLNFGFLLVRFGRYQDCAHKPGAKAIDCDEMSIINKTLFTCEKRYNKDGLKSDESNKSDLEAIYFIPVHQEFGVTFKLFVEVKNAKIIEQICSLIKANGSHDPRISDSHENNRIYFSLPDRLEFNLFCTKTPDHIINNYLCPLPLEH